VLWRCLVLLFRATPVVCASPVCWLLWDRGGEECFWQLVLAALQAHGPIAVKFAQWASTRPDLLPVIVCENFARLQADVRPHTYRETAETLAEAFGQDWADRLELEPSPIGSGCMAQVYRGQLRLPGEPGREVAVKVRHPGAQEKVDLDLEVMRTLVNTVEALWPSVRYLALSEALGYFEAFVRPQANLKMEAANLEEFSQNFDYARTGRGVRVRIPEVLRPLVTESVLVETYESATPLQAVLLPEQSAHQAVADTGGLAVSEVRERVGKLCMDAFLKMVFVDNFIHGDLHPGNILFRFPESDSPGAPREPELVLLDAGLAVRLNRRDRRNFVELFHALAMNNGTRAGQLMVERSPGDPRRVLDKVGFIASVERLVASVRGSGVTLGSVRLGEVFGEMLGLALTHRVKLETSFVQIATSIIVLEGVGRQLDPAVDLAKAALPLLVEAVTKKLW